MVIEASNMDDYIDIVPRDKFEKEVREFYRGNQYDVQTIWAYVAESHSSEDEFLNFDNVFLMAKPILSRYMADQFKSQSITEAALKRLTDDKVASFKETKFWQRAFLIATGAYVSFGAITVILLLRPVIGL